MLRYPEDGFLVSTLALFGTVVHQEARSHWPHKAMDHFGVLDTSDASGPVCNYGAIIPFVSAGTPPGQRNLEPFPCGMEVGCRSPMIRRSRTRNSCLRISTAVHSE